MKAGRCLTVALALGAVGLTSAAGPDPKAAAAPSKSAAPPSKAEPEKAPAPPPPKPEAAPPAPAPADAVEAVAEGDDACDAACQEEKEKFGSVDAPVRGSVRGGQRGACATGGGCRM